MITAILTAIKTNAKLGWLARRIWDWGGWIGGTLGSLLALFASLDPVTQGIILTVLQGRWQEITLGGAVGFIVWALSQWRSWRATVKPQAVTERGTRVEVPVLTEAEALALNERETGIKQTHIPRR
ncbi:hypothetical protein [Pelagibacterium mangrovi]|uniref:hypothetical protein n=1 Tax=Pelagibacterium mangrovi TaxID=3119828 RepID=UPI002FC8A110